MNEATAAPTHERVAALLAAMHGLEDVLLVLNHPFSCEMMVARAQHERLLASFLEEFGEWMHAYELNGLQPASNNIDTLKLAAARSKPVISGGDRHCLEPNANLNLTHAATFAEFVNEIRVERRSTVLFLPQYHDPIPCRYIEFIWQAVRNYPEFPGRVRWADRVYITQDDGESPSFQSLHPDGAPAVINGFISVIGFLARPGIRAVLSRAVGRGAELEPEAL